MDSPDDQVFDTRDARYDRRALFHLGNHFHFARHAVHVPSPMEHGVV
jgi:hypothetical protein